MITRILVGALLLIPVCASGDTLIMKDGMRLRGSFNNADSRRMTFTEGNGNRRDVNISDVQELRFGNEGQAYSSSNAPQGNEPNVGPLADSLDRLRQDLRIAMDNTNLGPEQRRTLEDARGRLQAELERSRNGRPVDQNLVRGALDNVRGVSDGLPREDRDRLNDDMRRISSFLRGQQGRDY